MSDEYPGPIIIVIGHPRLPMGPVELGCMNCPARRPAMVSTVLTVSQLKKQEKEFVVICWDCYIKARRAGLPNMGMHGNREGRKILGI